MRQGSSPNINNPIPNNNGPDHIQYPSPTQYDNKSYHLTERTPSRGKPGSKRDFPDGKGGKTQRQYGPDGRAVRDVDYGHDHGSGDPHVHDWDWSKPRGEIRGEHRPAKKEEKSEKTEKK